MYVDLGMGRHDVGMNMYHEQMHLLLQIAKTETRLCIHKFYIWRSETFCSLFRNTVKG